MIVVDSNVFVIDLCYRRDPLFRVIRRFLDRLAEDGSGAIRCSTCWNWQAFSHST